MSLPKEPRQLMINLMYLVLTAMLALNVSAEILNTLLSMDESIQESNQIVGRSNQALLESIKTQANAYPQYKEYEASALLAQEFTAEFCDYVESLKTNLIAASGGLDENQQPKGKKDKDTPTRIFVEQGLGNQLHDSILSTRHYLLNLVSDEKEQLSLEKSIPLKIKAIPEDTDKKTWAGFTFHQMPVAAVLPLLSKFQSDARVAETSLLNYLANKISAKPVHDEYKALVAADKSYVIRGEEINAEIFLGAYSSTTDNIKVKVNGQHVPVRNGKAQFTRQAGQIGSQVLNVEIAAKDPLTGVVKTYREKFNYEVGERSVTTSADMMNVFYVGVENPLSVSAAGVASADVQVSATGARISKSSSGKYIVKPERPGKAIITVSGGGLSNTNFEYRVKALPTPIAKLEDKLSGSMSPGEFKIYKRIYPHLENFDFNAKCELQGFQMVRLDKHGNAAVSTNRGGNFNERTKHLVSLAKRGDQYYFEKIKAKCPGDEHGRKLNSLFFKIK